MPESVWDNIYNGIKDFAGDENKANALIGGGIGAGIGGLIDGWRGAGIGAVGGGIAGYKINDIKNWWHTPTNKLKARSLLTKDSPVSTRIAAGIIDDDLENHTLWHMDTEERNKFFNRHGIPQNDPDVIDMFKDSPENSKSKVNQALFDLYRQLVGQ